MYCKNCGNKLNENADICLNCGVLVRKNNKNVEEDIPNVGLNILSFFIPLVGLILYVTFNKETPKKAKSCGKSALIGFCIPFALILISVIFSLIVYMVNTNSLYNF